MTQNDMQQAVAFAHAAVATMARHGIPPTPVNFTVWYEYHSGRDPGLNHAIDMWVASGKPFTPEAILDLYETYLSPARMFSASRETAARLESVMDALREHIGEAEEGTRAYGDKLAHFSGRLNAPPASAPALGPLVGAILSETRAMQERNEALEARLQETTSEVSELRRNFEQARRESLTDPLTGLANRKSFEQALADHARHAVDNREALSLLMIDIDHFKRFNDHHGHHTGDTVLQLVARMLSDNVKGQDLACRYGGEEFAVLLPRTRLDQAVALGNGLRKTISERKLVKRNSGEDLGRITISAGVAEYGAGEALARFVERADAALYAAKRGGRNRVMTLVETSQTAASA